MTPGRLVLAPMEGVADDVLRDVLTRIGGYDWCVTEFVRVSGLPVPEKIFTRIAPELLNGGRTRAGTRVRVQLLGSDPACLALNAAALSTLGPFGVDLNFGCPAPTVNRHRGGAALLNEPELLGQIVAAVRAAVPPELMVSAKMRLGITDTGNAIACAQALEAGGAQELVVHARTKADAYRPPAKWSWLGQIRQSISIPVIGNGDVFTVEDYERLRVLTGCEDVMIGRGAIADPFLAQRIRGLRSPVPSRADWLELEPLLAIFWELVKHKARFRPKRASGRLKMWLNPLRRTWPEAERLFQAVRLIHDPDEVDRVLGQFLRDGTTASIGAICHSDWAEARVG
jgi:tRNA-dihydrouridine synthase C